MILIDRETLCQDLLDRWNVADEKEEEEIQNVMADVVTPIVFSQPIIEAPSWIPCSEMLPAEGDDYLVTLINGLGDIEICVTPFGRFGWGSTFDDEEVIAWQPLPKPYKEEE